MGKNPGKKSPGKKVPEKKSYNLSEVGPDHPRGECDQGPHFGSFWGKITEVIAYIYYDQLITAKFKNKSGGYSTFKKKVKSEYLSLLALMSLIPVVPNPDLNN